MGLPTRGQHQQAWHGRSHAAQGQSRLEGRERTRLVLEDREGTCLARQHFSVPGGNLPDARRPGRLHLGPASAGGVTRNGAAMFRKRLGPAGAGSGPGGMGRTQ